MSTGRDVDVAVLGAGQAGPGAAWSLARQGFAPETGSVVLEFAGQHVVVVGGGASAVPHLADISRVASTTWVTRRPPVWRGGPFDGAAGRAAVVWSTRRCAQAAVPAASSA